MFIHLSSSFKTNINFCTNTTSGQIQMFHINTISPHTIPLQHSLIPTLYQRQLNTISPHTIPLQHSLIHILYQRQQVNRDSNTNIPSTSTFVLCHSFIRISVHPIHPKTRPYHLWTKMFFFTIHQHNRRVFHIFLYSHSLSHNSP